MKISLGWDKGVIVLLFATFVAGAFITPDFFNVDNVGFIMEDVTEILLIALPMAYLIIAGEIDLSVASTLTLTSATIGVGVREGYPMWLSVIAGLAVGTACGAFNGFLVTKVGLSSLAVTIGTLGLYRGLCYVLLGNEPVNEIPEAWTNLGFSYIPKTFLPWSFILVVLFGAIAWIILHHTRFGRWTFAVGINPESARFSGVPVQRVKFSLFVATGFMSGVAGLVYTLRFASASPNGAMGYELSVIAACLFGGVAIAGGIGTMWGVLASVLELGAIRSLLQLVDFSANALQIVAGGLLLMSVTIPRIAETAKSRRGRSRPSSPPKSPQPPMVGVV